MTNSRYRDGKYQPVVFRRKHYHKRKRTGRIRRNKLKGSSGRRKGMVLFTVKCSEARKSLIIAAENHKDAAQKSGLVIPGVNITVERTGGGTVWKRYQVDRSGRLKEIASYSV